MFISILDLFKLGIGPSSSHTTGPMVAAGDFIDQISQMVASSPQKLRIRCTLKGSLSFTGKGHATDRAVVLGLHGHTPESLVEQDVETLIEQLRAEELLEIKASGRVAFSPDQDILFDRGKPLPQHPNGMILELVDESETVLFSETYFSIGGGFIRTAVEMAASEAPLAMEPCTACPYPFDSARAMLAMAKESGLTIAQMKEANERFHLSAKELDRGLDLVWHSMRSCVVKGLAADGYLPGGLGIQRRAKALAEQLQIESAGASVIDWLCAYAMAVNEENAAGHMVVTAPTNGAAGVIPAVLYYLMSHENGTDDQIREFLLTAGAIGGLIKHRGSISGAEVGCQGEVGSASAMAAAGLCAVRGGTPEQVENAAEIALEHHLGMTCDPVEGLVQVPCIERNGFGAVKAYTAASLALRGSGQHFMPLDSCIAAMKQTGLEMCEKYKETSLGGLAVSLIEC